jgi:hypothetical protein
MGLTTFLLLMTNAMGMTALSFKWNNKNPLDMTAFVDVQHDWNLILWARLATATHDQESFSKKR